MCPCTYSDLFNPQIFIEYLCTRHYAREVDCNRYDPCPHAASVLVGEIHMQTDKYICKSRLW